ncbi:MAG: FRG domain-containing protein [Pirellulales bacterium]
MNAKTMNAIFDEIDNAKDELGCNADDACCWYRGQADADWGLAPGLIRPFIDRHWVVSEEKPAKNWDELTKTAQQAVRDELWEIESDMFWEAFTQARDLQEPGLDSWDVLFLMQHHGFPTRLLDWTEVLSVALHFAISKIDRSTGDEPDAAVWLLNPYRLNKKSWGAKDLIDPRILGWDSDEEDYYDYRDYMTERYADDYSEWPVAIYPAQKSVRMRVQSGRFTIHGRDIASLDELCAKVVRKVVIPRAAFDEVFRFLERAGVYEHVLFPDLDGMARSVRQRRAIAAKRR